MSDDAEWFAPKRYGYGAGLPISWQGWGLSIAYLVIVGTVAFVLGYASIASLSIFAIITSIFIFICARTTRGGWRWRWGDDD